MIDYICGNCGYDLRQQWDHGVTDRCMGCMDAARRKKKEALKAADFYACHTCGSSECNGECQQ